MTTTTKRPANDSRDALCSAGPDCAMRRQYTAPKVTDFGHVREVTHAGGASTNTDFLGANMHKFTMIG